MKPNSQIFQKNFFHGQRPTSEIFVIQVCDVQSAESAVSLIVFAVHFWLTPMIRWLK